MFQYRCNIGVITGFLIVPCIVWEWAWTWSVGICNSGARDWHYDSGRFWLCSLLGEPWVHHCWMNNLINWWLVACVCEHKHPKFCCRFVRDGNKNCMYSCTEEGWVFLWVASVLFPGQLTVPTDCTIWLYHHLTVPYIFLCVIGVLLLLEYCLRVDAGDAGVDLGSLLAMYFARYLAQAVHKP